MSCQNGLVLSIRESALLAFSQKCNNGRSNRTGAFTMKRFFALFLLLAPLCTSLHAQDKPPALLWEAAQCLATGKYEWVNVDTAKTIALGYQTDNKTFAGGKYLYVVVFNSPKRDGGKIFDIRVKDHHTFTIENNAKFTKGPDGITFTEPPLGGHMDTDPAHDGCPADSPSSQMVRGRGQIPDQAKQTHALRDQRRRCRPTSRQAKRVMCGGGQGAVSPRAKANPALVVREQ